MGREEKRREVDGAAVEGGDGKPVSKFFFGGEDHIFNFPYFQFSDAFPPIYLMSARGSWMKRV